MKTLATILTAAAILSITTFAQANIIELDDSGWQAEFDDNLLVDINTDDTGSHFVLIEIAKMFTDPPVNGQFSPISIDFTVNPGHTRSVPLLVVLNDEVVENNTGVDWTDYHWSIEGDAAFWISATDDSNFDIAPFTNATWTPHPTWGSDYASGLDVDGGTVSSGSTFFPGSSASGMLFIEVDTSVSDPSFTLTQNPTPEPATLIFLAAGLLLLLKRKRRHAALKA